MVVNFFFFPPPPPPPPPTGHPGYWRLAARAIANILFCRALLESTTGRISVLIGDTATIGFSKPGPAASRGCCLRSSIMRHESTKQDHRTLCETGREDIGYRPGCGSSGKTVKHVRPVANAGNSRH